MSPDVPARRAGVSLWGLLEAFTVLLLLATLAGFAARWHWLLELTSHWRTQLAVILAMLAVLWLARRKRWLAGACTLAAVVNTIVVLGFLLPLARASEATGQRLRIVVLNLRAANPHSDRILHFLRSSEADVLVLVEMTQQRMADLSLLQESPGQVFAASREDDFGLAIYSRLPMTNEVILDLGEAGVPSIAADVQLGDRWVHLLATHPLPPGSAEYAAHRNEQLARIARHVRDQPGPVIVAGDLNVTPWSPFFGDLVRDSRLRPVTQGRGVFGSWPAALPVLRVPLDHCLVSPAFSVVNVRLGSRVGSDHLPLVVDLVLPSAAASDGRPWSNP